MSTLHLYTLLRAFCLALLQISLWDAPAFILYSRHATPVLDDVNNDEDDRDDANPY